MLKILILMFRPLRQGCENLETFYMQAILSEDYPTNSWLALPGTLTAPGMVSLELILNFCGKKF